MMASDIKWHDGGNGYWSASLGAIGLSALRKCLHDGFEWWVSGVDNERIAHSGDGVVCENLEAAQSCAEAAVRGYLQGKREEPSSRHEQYVSGIPAPDTDSGKCYVCSGDAGHKVAVADDRAEWLCRNCTLNLIRELSDELAYQATQRILERMKE